MNEWVRRGEEGGSQYVEKGRCQPKAKAKATKLHALVKGQSHLAVHLLGAAYLLEWVVDLAGYLLGDRDKRNEMVWVDVCGAAVYGDCSDSKLGSKPRQNPRYQCMKPSY